MFSLLNEDQIDQFRKNKVLDFSHGEKDLGRFRINIYKQRGTMAVAIRMLPLRIPSLDELGLPVQIVEKLCHSSKGLVIVAGPVGSGKTTSLAAMVQYINTTKNCHIISIEDPIEYIHKNVKGLIHQRELHTDTLSFQDALKYGLREDPDVIVIGEMRDLETISSAITLAETGHLVLATLHTSDARESVSRMVDVFSSVHQAQIRIQLSFSLVGVISQLLLPAANNYGRIMAAEIMITTSAIQSLIRENKIEAVYSHIQLGSKFGMQTMNQSLFTLVRAGMVKKGVALSRSPRPKELTKLLREGSHV
jgi:twitching motility protein PilT